MFIIGRRKCSPAQKNSDCAVPTSTAVNNSRDSENSSELICVWHARDLARSTRNTPTKRLPRRQPVLQRCLRSTDAQRKRSKLLVVPRRYGQTKTLRGSWHWRKRLTPSRRPDSLTSVGVVQC